jgi:hypothetical protein
MDRFGIAGASIVFGFRSRIIAAGGRRHRLATIVEISRRIRPPPDSSARRPEGLGKFFQKAILSIGTNDRRTCFA